MNSRLQVDPWFFIPVLILTVISLITLFSIDALYFRNQLMTLIVSVTGYMIFSKINIDFLRGLKVPIYMASVLLLLLVFFAGVEARGASRWFEIFGIRLQFSEILKPFFAIALASEIAESNRGFRSFLKITILMIPIVILITLQPDLGSGLLYAGAGLFALLVMGFSLSWFIIVSLPFIFSAPFFWRSLHDYQRQRILTFIDKGGDPLGTSYNAIQAIIAIGSGSFFGKGISEGTQSVLRFLPERQTDFIFATIAEALGFFGASIVIIALFFILYRIFILFNHEQETFGKAFLAITFGFIFIQTFVNIAMNLGLLPIVGITLPFVSFGGSSLLSNFIFIGLMASFSLNNTKNKVLEIR
jgi:rod shape determining protein RodA